MSEYRRFISYIYEYQRGRKQSNCGYAKVEIRSSVFRLRMHLQPAGKDTAKLQVYGFVRRQGSIYGILLGSVGMKNHAYDFQTTSQAAHIGGTSYTAGDLCGIWLRGNGQNYITVWDDEPVAVEQFTDREPEESVLAEADDQKTVQETTERNPAALPEAAETNRAEQQKAIRESGTALPEAAETNHAEQQKAIRESGTALPETPEMNRAEQQKAIRESGTALPEANRAEQQKAMKESGTALPEATETNRAKGQKAKRNVSARGQGIQAQSMPTEVQRQVQSGTLAGRWPNFLQHYPQIYPFADEEITQCISIAPKDLSFLQREEWQFGKNTFLRQAYAQHHHLMLGCHACGRFVLAVPGNFRNMQEKHLARMYGFPYYKETAVQSGQEELCAAAMGSTEPEGYWYHFLNETCP